jgi:hypothetical protein
MKGLVDEGSEAIEEDSPPDIKDANLIGAAEAASVEPCLSS